MARGTIVKRGDSWRIAVELPPDPATGQRRQKWETIHGGKKDAERRLTELLTLLDQQRLGLDSKITLTQYLDRWLQDYASTLAPKTYHRYQQLARSYVVAYLGTVRVDQLTPVHFVRLQAILRDTDRQDDQGKLSAQTVRHVHRMLHVALETAVLWRVLATNPMAGLKAPSVPQSEMKTFTIEQAQAFLAASAEEGLKWRAFFTVAMTTGLRIGEVRGLRWQDVDMEGAAIRVQQNFQRIPGVGRVFKAPKNAGSRRPVDLDVGAVVLLRWHRAAQNQERLSLGPLWKDHGLVFPSQVGTPLEDKRIREVFHRVCDRAGVPRIRPYDLRHSCASLLLAAGVHPKIVAERLGHSSVNLTLTTYSHVLPTLQKDAAETLGRLLGKAPS